MLAIFVRWQEILSTFDFMIEYIKGETNSLPDFLTREFFRGKMDCNLYRGKPPQITYSSPNKRNKSNPMMIKGNPNKGKGNSSTEEKSPFLLYTVISLLIIKPNMFIGNLERCPTCI